MPLSDPLFKKHSLFFISLVFVLALFIAASAHASTTANTPQKRISLAGSWDFQALNDGQPETGRWEKINVPDNWVRQGKPDVTRAWYKKRFNLDAASIGRNVHLYFDGVDYNAEIWLNGQRIGRHIGYFQSFDFDVSSAVIAGSNELKVLVESPLEKPQDWSLHKRLIKGVFSHHDTRPGGAWSERGQEQGTGGMWAPVYLEINDAIAITASEIVPHKTSQGWQVKTLATISSILKQDRNVQLDITIKPENFSGQSFKFSQQQVIVAGQSQLDLTNLVPDPALWWPASYGKPNLYRMSLSMRDAGRELARSETVFGFREVSADPVTLQWQINGRRLFIRGTNYISTQWLAEMTADRYDRDIDLMQAANINAVRVHAHIEAAAFYERCDRKGMLVMQDFPLQWGYSDDADFIADARHQALDMLHELNHHPSIVSWTMHNEPPWEAPWMKDKYPDYSAEQNRVLDDLLFSDISALEQTRVVRKISATSEHHWQGWYFGHWQDYAAKSAVPWVTEYGAQALPNLASMKKIVKPESLWPENEAAWQDWYYHNFQIRETFELAGVSKGNNINEFIENSQKHQAQVIQYATESYRRQRYAPVSAIFQFMFNEDWPSINWGVVDYWRNSKLGYEALKTAFQPVLPSLEWSSDSYQQGDSAKIGLWLINDSWEALQGLDYMVRVSRNGQPIELRNMTVDIGADSGQRYKELKLEQLAAGEYVVEASVSSKQGKLLGSNRFVFKVNPAKAGS